MSREDPRTGTHADDGDGPSSVVLSLVIAFVIALANALGVEATLRLGAGIGTLWFRLRGPRTRRVADQLATAFPERDPLWLRERAREVFVHLAQGLAEGVLLAGRHRETLVAALEVEGLDHLEVARADADGRGALVVGPHLGNWELGAAKLTALGIPVAAVYRGPRQPALDRALRRLRGGEGEGGIEHIAMGRRAGVQFVRALTGGRNVLALLDQHARGDEGVPVTFFGRPASTRFGPLKLAARVGAPVLIASVRRSADRRRHTLTIEPALQLEPGASDDEEILRRNLQQVTAELERTIRANPGQWIWTHRRWRENPSETSAG